MSTIRARVKVRLARRKRATKKKPRVAGEFWGDVKAYRELLGGTQAEGREAVRASPKWVNKRWNRMSKKRRDLAEQETWKGGVKKTIIERAMEKAGITDMNQARDFWEAKGS